MPTLINSMYFTQFSRLSNNNKVFTIQAQLEKNILQNNAISLCFYSFLFFASYHLLLQWTGDIKLSQETYLTLSILSIAYFFNMFSSCFFNLYTALGRSKLPVYNNILAVLIFTPLSFLLCYYFGLVGIASSWLLYNLLYFLIFPSLVVKELSIKVDFLQTYKVVLLNIILMIGNFLSLELLQMNDLVMYFQVIISLLISLIFIGIYWSKLKT